MRTINIQNHLAVDEIINPAGLAAKICSAIKDNGILLTSNGEGFNFRSNGLYDVLDSICDVTGIPKNKIKIETWNLLEHHEEYSIIRKDEIFGTKWFRYPGQISRPISDKILILMGKCNLSRLRIHELVNKVSWREKIIYSFHMDMDITPWPPGIAQRLSAGQSYGFYKNTTPHSDIGSILPTPIVTPGNILGLSHIYEKTMIEIVPETVSDHGFFVTEKTLRPIFYGRPFLTVAPSGFEDNLRKLGFDLDFRFPSYLERLSDMAKADAIFRFLDNWEFSQDWFESIMPALVHNQQVLKELAGRNGKIDLSLFNS